MATLFHIIRKSIQRVYELGLGLAGIKVEVNILDMYIRVIFFGPLFEIIHFHIFCGVRILKILAAVKKKFHFSHPGPPWARFCDPGVPDHLETPQSSQMDLKMEIYVEIIYCEHFRFYWKNFFVSNFWDFV